MSDARYEIYPVHSLLGRRQWRWRYRAANGRVIASGEAYRHRSDCVHAIGLLQTSQHSPIRELLT